MNKKSKNTGYIDNSGRIVVSPEIRSQYGLTPGTKLFIEQGTNSLTVRQPITLLKKVYVEITNRCNLGCCTCIRNVWDEPCDIMPQTVFDCIIKSLQTVSPSPTVFFGGLGEPLLHEHVTEMIKQAKTIGSRVELITNATLLNEQMSRSLIDSGLDMLWVSMDGATQESYADVRVGASLDRVVQKIKFFRSARPLSHVPTPEIGIAFVAMRRNISDLPAVMRMAKTFGASRLMVSNVIPYTGELRKETLFPRLLKKTGAKPSQWVPNIKIPKTYNTAEFGDAISEAVSRGWNLLFGGSNLNEENPCCPFIEDGTTSVGWDGSLSPCLPLLHDHTFFLGDRKRLIKKHIIGNVADQPLVSLWNKPEHVAFREKVQRFDFSPCTACGGCERSLGNMEDCFGSSFPTCGGCLWAQGVVQCP